MIEEIVGLAENLTFTALIGAGGIRKTSIALAALHNHHIQQWFGVNRRFIRCEKFPASCSHLLNRLSNVISAGIENPEDLASLRPFLSPREILMTMPRRSTLWWRS